MYWYRHPDTTCSITFCASATQVPQLKDTRQITFQLIQRRNEEIRVSAFICFALYWAFFFACAAAPAFNLARLSMAQAVVGAAGEWTRCLNPYGAHHSSRALSPILLRVGTHKRIQL